MSMCFFSKDNKMKQLIVSLSYTNISAKLWTYSDLKTSGNVLLHAVGNLSLCTKHG